MRKLIKCLTLPLALMCCSMSPSNDNSIEYVSFGIIDDNPSDNYFRLSAYIRIKKQDWQKQCTYHYYWMYEGMEPQACGWNVIYNLTYAGDKNVVELTGGTDIDIRELDKHSPITFRCEASVSKEGTYTIEMPYNTKCINDFTIDEKSNNQVLDTHYLKKSTYPDSSKNYCYVDNITFSDFEDIHVNDVYYALDISYLRFKYQNGLDNFLKGTFTFAFYDRYNLFLDFPGGESMYRYIELEPHQNNGEGYFTFKTPMYYDPVTHDCSIYQKEGYIKTNKLMLPFKAAEELKFLPCYFDFVIEGHTKFHVNGKFMMTYLKRYFGDCENSEFCDELRQDDGINVREKVIEVVI